MPVEVPAKWATLTVVVPVRNEAANLCALLPRLSAELEQNDTLLIVDGGSDDNSMTIARLHGATALPCPANRGLQLDRGARQAAGELLLFLHADSRLEPGWRRRLAHAHWLAPQALLFHDLIIRAADPRFRLVELLVGWRSRLGRLPYGDQGLCLARDTYADLGGFRPLALMEDLELVQRAGRLLEIRPVGAPIQTSMRRWQRLGLLRTCCSNWQLRRAWRRGATSGVLHSRYYGSNQEPAITAQASTG